LLADQPAEFGGKRRRPLRNVASAETDDVVALPGPLGQHRRQRLWPVEHARVAMAASADARDELLMRDTWHGLLASGVNRRDQHRIGVIEAGGEVVEEIVQARIAVRLDDRDDIAPGRL